MGGRAMGGRARGATVYPSGYNRGMADDADTERIEFPDYPPLDETGTAVSLNNLGTAALAQQDYDAARAAYEESLAFSRQHRFQFEEA